MLKVVEHFTVVSESLDENGLALIWMTNDVSLGFQLDLLANAEEVFYLVSTDHDCVGTMYVPCIF